MVATAFLFLPRFSSAAEPDHLSLAGRWRFELDRANIGIEQKWCSRTLSGELSLPGSLPAQGIGDDVTVDTKWTGDIVDKSWFTAPEYAKYRQPGNVKVPFWLQPAKCYAGVAWYQREIEIPASWSAKRVVLNLERPHWETRVWLDDKPLGSNDSLSTEHEYDLGTGLSPGRHRLTIRVDNGLVVDIGVNSHSISDHTQGNWNGIVGRMELRATPPVWIDQVRLYPADSNGEFRLVTVIGNVAGTDGQGKLSVWSGPAMPHQVSRSSQLLREVPVQWSATGAVVETRCLLPQGPREFWDEFSPTLHPLLVKLSSGDSKLLAYGSREISTRGTQFLINGQKTFIRGTLECCIFPKTGHPPTDLDSWRRIIRIAKAHGLNLIRFHSWCPPEAAFDAADELGFYYQVEIASWANMSTTLGDGKPVDQWLYREADRIIKAYGNHPSFLLMPYGNEPGGEHHTQYLAKWVEHWKATDPRRLYTSASGWPELSENQFQVTPNPRIQAWGQGLKSRINARPPETTTDYREFIQKRTVPVISHEIGEWCVYPNFAEIPKYTGYLKPKNFEIFRDTLTAHHMADQAHQFLLASGKLQTLCYKEEIESALRTPGMGGFELLDLHDFPGQGTALVGVLDPFWDDKGYVTAQEFRRFCNSTVPLARLKQRVFTTGDALEADVEVAHFGPAPFEHASVTWALRTENGKVVRRGQLASRSIPLGNGVTLGSVSTPLNGLRAPGKYSLAVRIASASPKDHSDAFENDWDVWIYPTTIESAPASDVRIVHELNETTLSALNQGDKVLLEIPPDRVKGDRHGPVALGFSSIFWNTAWTGRQAPHTLGILCDPKGAALSEFPTEYHTNWQWWYLVSRAGAMILDGLPAELSPTVQVIDDWVTNRRLGLLFEAKVSKGKVMVCSIDLEDNLEQNPVARQMRHSVLRYMASSHFAPKVSVSAEQIRSLIK
ncbi:MAG TPA: glycoside hydrolase family 2 TIM barrel-domain containing protein [Verrucomicrobiae bacterium]|nr:glycoside hydrolase family 2 TIM barrel-domain containing protein [Verrucomicrobiae bacterium]